MAAGSDAVVGSSSIELESFGVEARVVARGSGVVLAAFGVPLVAPGAMVEVVI